MYTYETEKKNIGKQNSFHTNNIKEKQCKQLD